VTSMKCRTVTFISFFLVFFVTVSFTYAGQWVTFKGASESEDPFTLKGILTTPKGRGPYPAIVMLHGASGIEGRKKYLDKWIQRLAGWGYVSLLVDSFGPRGESDILTNMYLIPVQKRAQDAHDAKSYLAELPFVNRNRIALMGWSHGGWTVFRAIYEKTSIQNRGDPFRLAIAFYPYCDVPLRNLNAPLLILIGELDDWTPAYICRFRMSSGKTTHETILKVYPQVHHGFDLEGIDTSLLGHRLLYNLEAANDAIDQVRHFLAKYLK
jgi:dienelactone hydrolase